MSRRKLPPPIERVEPCDPEKPGHSGNGYRVKEEYRGAFNRKIRRPTDSGPIEVVDTSEANVPVEPHSNGDGA